MNSCYLSRVSDKVFLTEDDDHIRGIVDGMIPDRYCGEMNGRSSFPVDISLLWKSNRERVKAPDLVSKTVVLP